MASEIESEHISDTISESNTITMDDTVSKNQEKSSKSDSSSSKKKDSKEKKEKKSKEEKKERKKKHLETTSESESMISEAERKKEKKKKKEKKEKKDKEKKDKKKKKDNSSQGSSAITIDTFGSETIEGESESDKVVTQKRQPLPKSDNSDEVDVIVDNLKNIKQDVEDDEQDGEDTVEEVDAEVEVKRENDKADLEKRIYEQSAEQNVKDQDKSVENQKEKKSVESKDNGEKSREKTADSSDNSTLNEDEDNEEEDDEDENASETDKQQKYFKEDVKEEEAEKICDRAKIDHEKSVNVEEANNVEMVEFSTKCGRKEMSEDIKKQDIKPGIIEEDEVKSSLIVKQQEMVEAKKTALEEMSKAKTVESITDEELKTEESATQNQPEENIVNIGANKLEEDMEDVRSVPDPETEKYEKNNTADLQNKPVEKIQLTCSTLLNTEPEVQKMIQEHLASPVEPTAEETAIAYGQLKKLLQEEKEKPQAVDVVTVLEKAKKKATDPEAIVYSSRVLQARTLVNSQERLFDKLAQIRHQFYNLDVEVAVLRRSCLPTMHDLQLMQMPSDRPKKFAGRRA